MPFITFDDTNLISGSTLDGSYNIGNLFNKESDYVVRLAHVDLTHAIDATFAVKYLLDMSLVESGSYHTNDKTNISVVGIIDLSDFNVDSVLTNRSRIYDNQ